MKIGIKVRLINDAFAEAMQVAGFKTMSALSIKTGISACQLGEYLNLKKTPKMTHVIELLEKSLGMPIAMLFPDDLVKAVEKKPQTRFYFNRDVDALPMTNCLSLGCSADGPEIERERVSGVKKGLECLTERQRKVIELRFGFCGKPHSLRETAEKIGLKTTEGVRIIESKALRRLRHPLNVRSFEDVR